jgi:two-component system NtrC family sensor kinase
MRLTRKLTLALVLGITLVMAANALFQVRRENALFDVDSSRDQQVVGRVLHTAVELLWPAAGEVAAQQLIREASTRNSELIMRWVSLVPGASPQDAPLASLDQIRPVLDGKTLVVRTPVPTGDERRITYMPLFIHGEPHGALEISESLLAERGFTRTTEMQVAATTLVILLLCGTIASALGFWFVGRPIQALCEKARRVGAGDLSGPLDVRQRDEIGLLARELNAMCEHLAETNQRLTAATEERIATLEQLRHADRLKTVGQLASGVAHEVGTPLNVIAGRAKMISQRIVEGDDVIDNARIVADQAGRITTIIRQLLDFSRRRGPSLGAHDLRPIVARSVDLLGALARKRGITIAVEEPGRPLLADVDPAQMQQVLTNLILNGLQAMPGGGRLTLRLGRREASPPPDLGTEPADFATITVEDEGVGIPPDDLGHVFEPFFTTKDVGEGTGLGLSVAWGIVRDHGGWIEVESEPGRGSRFTVLLHPAHETAQPEACA